MRKNAELTKREWLLLSAYLDGELSPRKKRQVEELLQSKPASREMLEVLRRTRQVLQNAPLRKVPHNFTLTADMVRKPLIPPFSKVLSYSSALAGILLVIVFGLDIYNRSMFTNEAALRTTIEESQAVVLEKETSEDVQETPSIINWGPYSDGAYDYGLGGADDAGGMASGMGGGGGDEVPEAEVDPEILLDEDESMAEEGEELAQMEDLEAVPTEKLAEAEESFTDEADESDRLILGIPPEEKQGQIITERPVLPEPELQQQEFPWRLVEWVLAAAALVMGLGAFILRKHRK